MNTRKILSCMMLFCAASLFSVHAQQRAVTNSGAEVILYDNGTWEYVECEHHAPNLTIEEGGSGKSAEIVIDDDLLFVLTDGKLTEYRVLTGGPRLYDNMTGRLRRIGDYEIKYEFHRERLEQLGPYRIKYDFASERVSQIGQYRVEYDFHSDKISRIGDTRFEYSFFNGKLTDVKGSTPGVRITIF